MLFFFFLELSASHRVLSGLLYSVESLSGSLCLLNLREAPGHSEGVFFSLCLCSVAGRILSFAPFCEGMLSDDIELSATTLFFPPSHEGFRPPDETLCEIPSQVRYFFSQVPFFSLAQVFF